MKDWIFYPLIALIAGAMIFVALSFGGEARNVDVLEGIKLKGSDLQEIVAAPGTSITIAGDTVNPYAYGVLGAHVSRENAPPSAGVFKALGANYSEALAKKRLLITVRARRGRMRPADKFDIAFFAGTGGSTGWKTSVPTDEFVDYRVETRLGIFNPENPMIYIGIWPDVDGENRTIEVESISLEVLED